MLNSCFHFSDLACRNGQILATLCGTHFVPSAPPPQKEPGAGATLSSSHSRGAGRSPPPPQRQRRGRAAPAVAARERKGVNGGQRGEGAAHPDRGCPLFLPKEIDGARLIDDGMLGKLLFAGNAVFKNVYN